MHTRIVGQVAVIGLLVAVMVGSGNGPMNWKKNHSRKAENDNDGQHR